MNPINQFTKALSYLRQTDSQRSRNDFHIVHLHDSRPPQLATSRTGSSVRNAPPRPALASQVWGYSEGPRAAPTLRMISMSLPGAGALLACLPNCAVATTRNTPIGPALDCGVRLSSVPTRPQPFSAVSLEGARGLRCDLDPENAKATANLR
jgi:hypothetical protein